MARILICIPPSIPLPPNPPTLPFPRLAIHPVLSFAELESLATFSEGVVQRRQGVRAVHGEAARGRKARRGRKGGGEGGAEDRRGANGWKYHSRTRRTKLPICLGRSFLFSDSAELFARTRVKLHPSSFISHRCHLLTSPFFSLLVSLLTSYPSSKAPAQQITFIILDQKVFHLELSGEARGGRRRRRRRRDIVRFFDLRPSFSSPIVYLLDRSLSVFLSFCPFLRARALSLDEDFTHVSKKGDENQNRLRSELRSHQRSLPLEFIIPDQTHLNSRCQHHDRVTIE